MITTAIIQAVLACVSAVLSLIPTWSVDTSSITATASGFGGFAGDFNDYIPEHLIVICLGILLTVKVGLFIVKALIAAYRMIPFNG